MIPWSHYLVVADNRFREDYGLFFEEFVTGQTFCHRPGITISQQDNKEEALDTINAAQLHYDQHYAEQTEWKRCLGVSTLTLQRVLGMTSKTLARKVRMIRYDSIEMTHPVFDGDTLYAETTVLGKEERSGDAGAVSFVTRGINQRGDEVATITYCALIDKQAASPGIRRPQEARFSGYSVLKNGAFLEQVGLYYEDFQAEEIYEHRPGKSFTAEENRLHALRSLDLDPKYATHVNENFLLAVVTALTTRTFGRVVANLGWNNIVLPTSVCAGDTIYATSQILDKRESKSRPTQGIMHVKTEAHNQKQELVCAYERFFLIYKKGLGPYEAAGY